MALLVEAGKDLSAVGLLLQSHLETNQRNKINVFTRKIKILSARLTITHKNSNVFTFFFSICINFMTVTIICIQCTTVHFITLFAIASSYIHESITLQASKCSEKEMYILNTDELKSRCHVFYALPPPKRFTRHHN